MGQVCLPYEHRYLSLAVSIHITSRQSDVHLQPRCLQGGKGAVWPPDHLAKIASSRVRDIEKDNGHQPMASRH